MKEIEKQGGVPRLRFPEFREAGEWKNTFGDEIFYQINNKDHNSDLPVLAITREHGAIPRDMIGYHVSVTEKSIESYKIVEIGDFIISLRSFQGGIEYSGFNGICSPAYVILRIKQGYIADYFRHFLKTDRFIGQLTKNIEGLRDGKMVSYKQFSELLLPSPSQMEQQKIADCLSSLDDLITLESQKLNALKTHKKGLMQQLFPAEGETVPRLRFPEFREAGEWGMKKLADILTFQAGFPFDSASFTEEKNGLRLVRNRDLKSDDKVIFYSGLFDNNYIVDDGDVLVGMDGDFTPFVWNKGKALLNQRVGRIITRKQTSRMFVYYFLMKHLKTIEEATARTTVKHLSHSDVEKICEPLPTFTEQQKIADCLSSLDDLIAAQAQKVEVLKTHKKGLMQQLFPVLDDAIG
jgi:type I restriction enzyme S subunit